MAPLTHQERGKLGGRPSKYTEPEIERGLQTLALLGSSVKASEETGIPEATLQWWRRDRYADRFQTIRREIMPKVYDQIASESEDLARRYAEVEHDLLDQFATQMTNLAAKDQASAIRNLSTSRAISTDKASLLRGRPTSIEQKQDVAEILTALDRIGIKVQTPVIDAQVVDPKGEAIAQLPASSV